MPHHATRRRHAEPEHAPRPARAPRHPVASHHPPPGPARGEPAAAPAEHLPFRFDPARVAARHDDAASPDAHATPHATSRAARPRPLLQPADVAVHTAAARPEIPQGAILLSEPPVNPERLLRHATSIVRDDRLPLSGQSVTVGGRAVALVDAPIGDLVAREALDPLHIAAAGRVPGRPQLLEPRERRDALALGRARLLAHLEARRVDRADHPAAFAAFDEACAVQEQILVGLGAVPRVDELGAIQGLAPPTLLATHVAQQIDALLPAIDSLSKTVTTLTRLQAVELSTLSTTLIGALGAGKDLPASFSAFRFGFLSGLVFLRASLSTFKGVLYTGDAARPKPGGHVAAGLGLVQAPVKLLEGLLGGLFLLLAVTQVARNDPSAAATVLARYTAVGRGLVWTAAFAQFFAGLTRLTAAAIGDEKFKRSALFDVAYGGAGALAPVQKIAEAAGKASLERANEAALARYGPLWREFGLEIVETPGSRLASRIANFARGRAGRVTGYAFAADIAVQMVQFGLKHHEQSSVGLGLVDSLTDVERFGGETSALAIALHEAVDGPTPAAPNTRTQAHALHDFMSRNLFALRRRHEDRRGPSTLTHSYPALGRRLAAAEDLLRRADPDDPASVLLAARAVLGALRKLFHEAPKILAEELAALDASRTFFNDTHTPPP